MRRKLPKFAKVLAFGKTLGAPGQTAAFESLGERLWAEYGREMCLRLEAILRNDF